MAEFDFDAIGTGSSEVDTEDFISDKFPRSGFSFESIRSEPKQAAMADRNSLTFKLVNGGLDLFGVRETLAQDIGDVADLAAQDLLSGRAFLRGADILFSPFTATGASVKAKILDQDAADAFTNRIVQSLGVAELVNQELGGNTNIAKTPEQLKFEATARGESDSMTDLQIAGLVMADLAEVFAPIPGLRAGKVGELSKIGPKLQRLSLKAGETLGKSKKVQSLVKLVKPLKEKGISSMNKFLQKSGPKKTVSFFERAARSVGSRLKTLGKPGIELFERMKLTRDKSEIMAGKLINDMENNIKGMSAMELEDFVKILDGQPVTKPSDRVVRAAEAERGRLNAVYGLADDATGGSELPVLRENYFPHIFALDDLAKGEFKKKAIKDMVDSGNFPNVVEATRAYEGFGAELKGRKYGNLETSRLSGAEGWIKDPKEALSVYYTRSSRRIQEAKYLGVDDDIVKALVDDIDKLGADANFAQRSIENFTGKNMLDDSLNKFLAKVNGFEVITKLGFAQIANAPQGIINTAFNSNIKTALQAFGKSFTKEGREFAKRTGSILNNTLNEFARIGAEGGVKESMTTKFLRNTGFTALETQNRIVASLGGKLRAEWAFDVMKNATKETNLTKKAKEVLNELGMTDEALKAAFQRGALAEDELLQAGLNFSNKTQFRSDVLSLPEFFRSGWGKTLFQFKSFAFNHARFLKDVSKTAIKRAARGDVGALANFLANIGFASAIGEIPRDLRLWLKGKSVSEREAGLERMADNFGAVGGLGIFSDLHNSLSFGQSGVFGFVTGPAVSDAVRTSTSILGPLSKGDISGAAKSTLTEGVRNIPGFGPSLSKKLKKELK